MATRRRRTRKKSRPTKLNWDQFDNEIKLKELSFQEPASPGQCQRCGAITNVSGEGFIVCTDNTCATMTDLVLDDSAEWRCVSNNSSRQSDPTRCGMPINPLLRESSFGGKVLVSSGSSYEMRKVARYTDWLGMPYKEKSHYDDFQKIQTFGSLGGIPPLILEDAKRYYKKIAEVRTFRGLNREGIMAASVYIAARANRFPRSAKEIARVFKMDQTSATRGCKNAVSIINVLESQLEPEEKTMLFKTTPTDFVDRYASSLSINGETRKLIKFVTYRVDQESLIPENTPNSIAAGAVWFVSVLLDLGVKRKDISTISEISEVTINKCYKKLVSHKSTLVPSKFLKDNKSLDTI